MKKLYRVDTDKKIAGICTGVGEMLEIDSTIVRLAFVFAAALTGVFPLIITYAVGWVIIPQKASRKIEEGDLKVEEEENIA